MTPPRDHDRRPQDRIPKNRARALIVGTFLLMIVVVFGYMLLIG